MALPAPHLRPAYDHVVVGGGAAGCVLARRLAEGGPSVLLIKAGPAGASDTQMVLAVKRGLQFSDIGSASAIGNVMILCLAAAAALFALLIRRGERAAP